MFHIRQMPPRSRLYVNGTVLTMDKNNTTAEAMAVERGRIAAVGTNEGN